MSAPARKAETLFETSTIAEIREVEAKAKAEIEDKKAALRHLVGDSYRDLISSADSILVMANTCAAAVDNVTAIQVGLEQLAERLGSEDLAAGPDASAAVEASKRKELYAVGARVKFLLDTPEALWGHLDADDFLQAACRFLRAQGVHSVVEGEALREVMRPFPLVRTQWPLVANFRVVISEGIRRQLSRTVDLSGGAAAEALAAAALLEEHSSQQALELFLSMRLELLRSRLLQGGCIQDSDLPKQLAAIATGVQDTVAQVGEIFLARSAAQRDAVPLLPSAVAAAAGEDSGGGGELPPSAVFCGPGVSPGGESPPASEAEMWQESVKSAQRRLGPLQQQVTASEATAWLGNAADAVGEAASKLLAPAEAPCQLAAAEGAARAAVSSWGETRLGGWSVIADKVLGQSYDVWVRVFEPAFLERSKYLIAAAFTEAEASLGPHLEAALEAASSQPAAPAGTFCSIAWPPTATFGPLTDAHPSGWRQDVEKARAGFDARLAATLEGTLLLSRPPARARVPIDGGGGSRGSIAVVGVTSSRGLQLQPYVQDRCLAAVMAAAEKLEVAFTDITATSPIATSDDDDITPRAEAALAVARLSCALYDGTPLLQVILGDPASWQSDVTKGNSAAAAPSRVASSWGGRHASFPAASSNSKPYLKALRSVAVAALEWWASWAAATLSAEMAAVLMSDVALTSDAQMRGWRETTVPAEEDDSNAITDDSGGSMKFWLPGTPSPALMATLLAADREADRAGGHVAPQPALELLMWHLDGSCLAVFHKAAGHCSNGSNSGGGGGGDVGRVRSKLTERGVLQLLFDCAVARRVLRGGQPAGGFDAPSSAPSRASPAVAAQIADRQQQWAEVEEVLQGRLDPIDWATYEPHLTANAAEFCGGAAVLLGTLLRLSPQEAPPSDAAHSRAGSDSNILAVAPLAERFAYLPVAVPAAAQAALNRSKVPAALLDASGRGGDDDNESYSFVDLMGSYAAWGTASVTSPTGDDEGPAFEAVHSRAGARLGAFGSLLGDKAAEAAGSLSGSLSVSLASAAGSTGLGNYLQPVAASSLLTSFRSRWQT